MMAAMAGIDIERVRAIDVHTHAQVPRSGEADPITTAILDAAAKHFRSDFARPNAEEVAAYYREREMAAVIFCVDNEANTGEVPVSNDEVLEVAAANADVLIPFVSLDPHRGKRAVTEARRLIAKGARGFKFHPNLQAFFPNDRLAYELYGVIEEAGLPALFHTGHSGMGSGLPGGAGIRLKYSNPMHVDDVAVDFPGMPIVLAHPSFPWQEEAISVAMHKAQVYIDLSGWSPKLFPPVLVQYANTVLQDKVLFGSDYPVITPDRWLADLEKTAIEPKLYPKLLKHNAARLLGLSTLKG
jgi:predicted TIM-barrel fold metal-dependent hydrolase